MFTRFNNFTSTATPFGFGGAFGFGGGSAWGSPTASFGGGFGGAGMFGSASSSQFDPSVMKDINNFFAVVSDKTPNTMFSGFGLRPESEAVRSFRPDNNFLGVKIPPPDPKNNILFNPNNPRYLTPSILSGIGGGDSTAKFAIAMAFAAMGGAFRPAADPAPAPVYTPPPAPPPIPGLIDVVFSTPGYTANHGGSSSTYRATVAASGVNLTTGNGNDEVTLNQYADNATINTGRGNDKLVVQGTLDAGGNMNHVSASRVDLDWGDDEATIEGSLNGVYILGSGNNTIRFLGNHNMGNRVVGGVGQNTAVFEGSPAQYLVQTGAAANELTVTHIATNRLVATLVDFLPANVTFTLPGAPPPPPAAGPIENVTANNQQLHAYAGDTMNRIVRLIGDNNRVNFGPTSGTTQLLVTGDDNMAQLGSGADTVTITGTLSNPVNNTVINAGDGDDSATLSNAFNSVVVMGNGNNTVTIADPRVSSGNQITGATIVNINDLQTKFTRTDGANGVVILTHNDTGAQNTFDAGGAPILFNYQAPPPPPAPLPVNIDTGADGESWVSPSGVSDALVRTIVADTNNSIFDLANTTGATTTTVTGNNNLLALGNGVQTVTLGNGVILTRNNSITTSSGNDVITLAGNTQNNTVNGGAGDDDFNVIIGNGDTIDGGSGYNRVFLSGSRSQYNFVASGSGVRITNLQTGKSSQFNNISAIQLAGIDASPPLTFTTQASGEIHNITAGAGGPMSQTINGTQVNWTGPVGQPGNRNVTVAHNDATLNVDATGDHMVQILGNVSNTQVNFNAAGNNRVDVAAGVAGPTLNFGAGNDTLNIGAAGAPVTNVAANLGDGTNTVTAVNINGGTITGGGADTFNFDNVNALLDGGDGNDNFVHTGGPLKGTVDGGAGTDTLTLAGNQYDYDIQTVGNTMTIRKLGTSEVLVARNIENIVYAQAPPAATPATYTTTTTGETLFTPIGDALARTWTVIHQALLRVFGTGAVTLNLNAGSSNTSGTLGDGDDVVNVAAGVSGLNIDLKNGTNTVNFAAGAGGVRNTSLTGGAGIDNFVFSGEEHGDVYVDGAGGTGDTLRLGRRPMDWAVDAPVNGWNVYRNLNNGNKIFAKNIETVSYEAANPPAPTPVVINASSGGYYAYAATDMTPYTLNATNKNDIYASFGQADDTFNLSGATQVTMYGKAGRDTFNLTGLVTGRLYGDDGIDTFNVSAAAATNGSTRATLTGGAGNDTLNLAGPQSAWTVTTSGSNTIYTHTSGAQLTLTDTFEMVNFNYMG